MRARLGAAVDYRTVDRGGAARAAALIAPLIVPASARAEAGTQ